MHSIGRRCWVGPCSVQKTWVSFIVYDICMFVVCPQLPACTIRLDL